MSPSLHKASFFQLGLGLPMRQGLEGLRSILLGAFPTRLPQNVGILGAYLGFNVCCLCAWLVVLNFRVAAEVRRRKEEEEIVGTSLHYESAPVDKQLDGVMVWNASTAVALSASSKAVGATAG